MINFTEKFFDLAILRISDLMLHETTETRRLRNIFSRISASKYLMNPVIIGKYGKDLILIDGANRLSTLQEIGCKLVIAQVIDYRNNKIKLKNWNHIVYNTDIQYFINFFNSTKNYSVKSVKHSVGEESLKNKFNNILISDIKTAKSFLITFKSGFKNTVSQLNNITKSYFGTFPFDRSEEEISVTDLVKFSRKNGVLIEFPKFKKNDVVSAARNNIKIPAGITRHILINRVLHVRYEIKKLFEESDIDKKNIELKKYLINKIDNNKVRQYRESVIVFDE